MNRRAFLSVCSGTIVGLSGCSGGDGETGPVEDQTPGSPPSFRVERVEAPDEVELSESFEASISVRNEGAQDGTYRSQAIFGESEIRGQRKDVSVEVPGGQVTTTSVSFEAIGVGEMVVTVADSDITDSIQVNPLNLNYGETFRNFEGYELQATGVDFHESYKAWDNVYGEVKTYEPENGDLFAFVQVEVKNTGDGEQPPILRTFLGRVGSELIEPAIRPSFENPDFRGQFEDIQLYQSGEIPAGSTRTGHIVFEVGSDERDSFSFGWSSRYSPDQVVYWS